jgi:antitoxin component of MazEF toxin-antitoxin module
MIKKLTGMSKGCGLYFNQKMLEHLGVSASDQVVVELLEDSIIIIRRLDDFIDEDTINDLLMRLPDGFNK